MAGRHLVAIAAAARLEMSSRILPVWFRGAQESRPLEHTNPSQDLQCLRYTFVSNFGDGSHATAVFRSSGKFAMIVESPVRGFFKLAAPSVSELLADRDSSPRNREGAFLFHLASEKVKMRPAFTRKSFVDAKDGFLRSQCVVSCTISCVQTGCSFVSLRQEGIVRD